MTRHVNCCVPGCKSRGTHKDVTFHNFPPDTDTWMVTCVRSDGRVDKLRRRKMWEDRLLGGRKASNLLRVCSLHFQAIDFIPTWEGRVRKSVHLKKTALPSCNLPFENAKDSSGAHWTGLERELPDGTVCEFFTSRDEDAENSSRSTSCSNAESDSNDEGSTADVDCSGSAHTKRIAPGDPPDALKLMKSQAKEDRAKGRVLKAEDIFEFECIVESFEKGTSRLPSRNWSYTVMNRSVLMFLCWDRNLKLTKKAVLRKGSPLELYCDDRLLASNAELPVSSYAELELALYYLNKYEWCTGVDDGSSDCALYTLNGTCYCTTCSNLLATTQNK